MPGSLHRRPRPDVMVRDVQGRIPEVLHVMREVPPLLAVLGPIRLDGEAEGMCACLGHAAPKGTGRDLTGPASFLTVSLVGMDHTTLVLHQLWRPLVFRNHLGPRPADPRRGRPDR